MSRRVFTLNVSSVPGPREDVYALGARVREPCSDAEIVEHHVVRVAVISAAGMLLFGLCADRDAVDDIELDRRRHPGLRSRPDRRRDRRLSASAHAGSSAAWRVVGLAGLPGRSADTERTCRCRVSAASRHAAPTGETRRSETGDVITALDRTFSILRAPRVCGMFPKG
jgi:hypothetical protein